MIGELTAQQIIALSQQGAVAEDIASALNEPLENVKVVLKSSNQGSAEDQDISDDQLALIRQQLVTLALYGADESVRYKACQTLLERKRPSKKDQTALNVTVVNQQLAAANKAYNRMLEDYGS